MGLSLLSTHPKPLRRMALLFREVPHLCDFSRRDSLRPGESYELLSQIPFATSQFFGEPLGWFPDDAYSDVAPVIHQCTRGEMLVNTGWTRNFSKASHAPPITSRIARSAVSRSTPVSCIRALMAFSTKRCALSEIATSLLHHSMFCRASSSEGYLSTISPHGSGWIRPAS